MLPCGKAHLRSRATAAPTLVDAHHWKKPFAFGFGSIFASLGLY